uniref:Mobile element protein n=1 Tax=Macrostomum lignano TaxID=282301 RepID=A0A1I8G0F4_9PLAT
RRHVHRRRRRDAGANPAGPEVAAGQHLRQRLSVAGGLPREGGGAAQSADDNPGSAAAAGWQRDANRLPELRGPATGADELENPLRRQGQPGAQIPERSAAQGGGERGLPERPRRGGRRGHHLQGGDQRAGRGARGVRRPAAAAGAAAAPLEAGPVGGSGGPSEKL